MKKDVLFEFKGAKFYKDTLYKLAHKLDLDAPESWRAKGITKAPLTGDTAFCKYDEEGERYDTGFELHSPRYKYVSQAAKVAAVDQLKKNIVTPFLSVIGKEEDELKMYNTNFWDNYIVNFNEQTSFNTTDPRKAMELYIAVTSGRVVPKDTKDVALEGTPYFDKASYIVYSESETYAQKTSVTGARFKAVSAFSEMLETNSDTLMKCLTYMGIETLGINGGSDLLSIFEKFVEVDTAKIDKFNNVMELVSTEEGELEVQLYYALKYGKNPKIARHNNMVVFDGVEIGKTIREAAKKLSKNNTEEGLKIISGLLID